jgi:type IV pilus assembly protein PilA
MKALEVILFLAAVLWPFYLVYFLVARYRAWKRKSKKKPPIIEFLAYTSWFAIAVAVAIPNYRKPQIHYKNSEAKANLGAIYAAQLYYFSNTNTYAGGPDTFKLIQWEPSGQNRYVYYCQGVMIPNKLSMHIDYVPSPEGRWPVDLKPQSSKTGFTCMAVGNIDNDETLDVWSINDAKILVNDQSDI